MNRWKSLRNEFTVDKLCKYVQINARNIHAMLRPHDGLPVLILSPTTVIRWAWLLSNQTISCFTNRIPMRQKIPENHKRKDQ